MKMNLLIERFNQKKTGGFYLFSTPKPPTLSIYGIEHFGERGGEVLVTSAHRPEQPRTEGYPDRLYR